MKPSKKVDRDDIAGGDAGLRRGRLDGLLGFHLRMAHVALYRDFAAAMEDLGFTQKQLAVLELVAANPGTSQIDLAAALETDRATMLGLVERLEERDLISRQPSETDRRRQELRLTPLGETRLAEARAAVDAHEARLLKHFSKGEADTLIGLLKRLYQE
ncbi:MarR family winged helix-turn-helix transcriptional regulator [Segnochrobactrum spirostomi]|uniref:MarR family winged helix-turn-helix transcriptional regulator n=1 Tax=Segnochrobactrum spirostomi TaxID=2608987 RepID=UPI0028B204BA|nr:MarR family transcriptional regulator [Segnochrobactrum spirostomi]